MTRVQILQIAMTGDYLSQKRSLYETCRGKTYVCILFELLFS